MSAATLFVVRLVVALGMIVVVPLGLRLIGGVPGPLARWWPVVGVAGAGSLWLPRGPIAGAAALAYAAATALLVVVALRRALMWWRAIRTSGPSEPSEPSAPGVATVPVAVEVAVWTALAGPAVAATALVAERVGFPLFGFEPGVLTLTVPHLHFAGFAAALVAGLVARRVAGDDPPRRRAAAAAALTVPGGTVLVLVGYFVGDWAELAGAVVLTVGLWLAGWLTWTGVRGSAPGAARALFGISAVVLVATMMLALSWALGEAAGWPHPSLDWMVATHGVTNAIGFALCGVLAWRLVREAPL